jgi:UDP-N-acetylmuramoyl-tripeptide--D-alanyl-D-alanine ligase
MISIDDTHLRQLFSWLGTAQAATLKMGNNVAISGVCTDSRSLKPGNLFIAIVGDAFDGHDFVIEAQKIAAAVLVERPVDGLRIPSILVKSTRTALGEIAAAYRQQFTLPIISVAGSNGKTTVKEMIASILSCAVGEKARLSTQGNLNNDLGVPFTLFRLNQNHRLGVVEIGMNHPGEIAAIAHMTKAKVALVNNAQREHQEFMDSVEATAIENGAAISALNADGIAVFPFDDDCANVWRTFAKDRQRIEFGLGDVEQMGLKNMISRNLSYVFADASSQPSGFEMRVRDAQSMSMQSANVELQIDGQHNVRNALAAAACCLGIGLSLDAIVRGLRAFVPARGRLVRHQLANGANLIDDSYNANPDSVRAAISILAGLTSPKILVLGDMGEVGTKGTEFHAEVGLFAKEQRVDHLLLLGSATRDTALAAGGIAQHFENVEALIASARLIVQPPATVLVKGSRFMKMERVVLALTEAADAA